MNIPISHSEPLNQDAGEPVAGTLPIPPPAMPPSLKIAALNFASLNFARKHTQRVKWLKRAFMMVASLLLILVLVWPFLRQLGVREALLDGALQLALAAPRFSGVDEAGRAYTLSAEKATQIEAGAIEGLPGRIALLQPRGDLELASGHFLTVRAENGDYDAEARTLILSEAVEIFRDDGLRFATDRLAVDLAARSAVSDRPSRLQGGFGFVEGSGMVLGPNGTVVRFMGPARAILRPASASK